MNKEDPTASEVSENSLDYEKDPRFIEFIKDRYEASFDHSRLVDGHQMINDLRIKYGLEEI